MNSRRAQVAKYVIADVAGAALAWTLFWAYRKLELEPLKLGIAVPLEWDANYFKGLFLVPLFWFGLYTAIGGYRDVFRRHRTKELGQTLLVTTIGVLWGSPDHSHLLAAGPDVVCGTIADLRKTLGLDDDDSASSDA